jgi:hypothetical protein
MEHENLNNQESTQLGIGASTCRFIGGFQDTRTNKEDFALTPYLFGVWVIGEVIKVRGIGICWGYYSFYLGLGWNIPKNYPNFKALSKNGN